MKRTIFALIVLAVIIGLGVGEQVYLHHLFEDLNEKTRAIARLVDEDDMGEAHHKTVELQEWWNKNKHFLEAVVSHNETKEVTLRIAELEGYIAIDDQKSSYATAQIMVELSTNLPHLLGFSWDTVL